MTDKPRCRPLPPSVIEGRASGEQAEADADKEMVARLLDALGELPDAERTAVIASIGYDEGVVGAAVELDVETIEAAALGERGLHLLRRAMREEE
jgi:DNA-directed RNA polymerase specialized sigma24 family protein